MAAVVIDANLAVGLVRQMPFSDAFRRLLAQWIVDGVEVAAPGLWDYEVATAMRKLWQQQALSREQAFAGLEQIMRCPSCAILRNASCSFLPALGGAAGAEQSV